MGWFGVVNWGGYHVVLNISLAKSMVPAQSLCYSMRKRTLLSVLLTAT